MAAIKPIDQSSDKWQRRASVAGPDYQAGIDNPRANWQAAATAAAQAFATGVQAAITAGRFAAGVAKAGNAKWQANAKAKGPGRFAEGVALAVGNWQKGFQPVHSAFASLTPPARQATGSPGNLTRVAAFNEAARRAVGRSGTR